MKLFLVVILSMIIPIEALAQSTEGESQSTEEEYSSRQVGLVFSSLGGAGIHYIIPTSERDNIKMIGILIYRDELSEKKTFFSIGVEYHRDLVESETNRAYFLAGGHFDNRFSNVLYFDHDVDNSKTVFFNSGIGLGFDFGNAQDGMALNAHISYQLTTGFGDVDRTRIGLGGGVGIGFNF